MTREDSGAFGSAERARIGRTVRALVGAVFVLATSPIGAEEWAIMGARYQGMGGAGVAVVDDEHAPYWNPGALAFSKRSIGLSLPVGTQVAAEGSVLADVDRVANTVDAIGEGQIDALISDIEAGNALNLAQAGQAFQLLTELPGLDQPGEGLVGNAHASLLGHYKNVGVSGIGLVWFGADPVFDRVNVSLTENSGVTAVNDLVDPGIAMDRYPVGGRPDVVNSIETLFSGAGAMPTDAIVQAEELIYQAQQAGVDVNDVDLANFIVDIVNASVNTAGAANTFANNNSGAFVRGLAVEEIGLAYGHAFWKNRIGVGANVKYMYGTTFNTFVRYDDVGGGGDLLSELSSSDRRETTHTGSLDLGVLVKPFEWLRFGVTARNVTAPKFDLARDPTMPSGKSELTLDPQLRAGMALWVLPNWVFAIDSDLYPNESDLLQGYESQLFSFGTEYRIPIWKLGLALRAGGYTNMAADKPALALTGGLGLRVFGFNFDLAGGASTETEKVEAADNAKIPSRINFSAMVSYRYDF